MTCAPSLASCFTSRPRCQRAPGGCYVPRFEVCHGCGALTDTNGRGISCYGVVICPNCDPEDVWKTIEDSI